VPPPAIPAAIRVLSARGIAAAVIGEVGEASSGGSAAYIEGELESIA
jgi:hypothetical protein